MSNSVVIKKNKIESLQALRTLAFLAIYISHCNTDRFGFLGSWGVSVFFILSGFVLVYSYYDREVKVSFKDCARFSVSKIKKLYPLHCIVLVIALSDIISGIIHAPSAHNIISNSVKVVLNLLLLQSWIPNKNYYFSINSVAWYLSACVFLYAVFPVILSRIKKFKTLKQPIVLMIIVFAVQLITGLLVNHIESPVKYSDSFTKWFTYIFPCYRCGDFIIGCCLGNIFLKSGNAVNKSKATLAELITLGLIVLTLIAKKSAVGLFSNHGITSTVIYTITSAGLIYLFSLNKGVISAILTNRATIYMGNISAYAYLLHLKGIGFAKLISNKIQIGGIKILVTIVLGIFITIALSEIYIYAEKRIKNRIHMGDKNSKEKRCNS